MEPKRYYFKLEMEQLPDDVWQQFKYSDIVKTMKFQDKLEIVEQIETLPEPIFDNLKQTLRKIRDENFFKLIKANPEKFEWFLTASVVVSEEERRLEALEDEAWKDL
ncbi:hypothetical protein PN499_21735 [Kamptonema animale CS-326]|jgi:hypothetical protein|uniref:hypothetical protein n=1 Tax=Kamptonema animale TaxID=92934 RepID=UPI00232F0C5E|nr:hypothetical protein [Kamptonema animale]MDB9513823.1 hypothetical protein [Kamptonema animale CS-326]